MVAALAWSEASWWVGAVALGLAPLLARTRGRVDAPATRGVRSALLAAVAAHPGIDVTQLVARLAIGWGTVYHHLRHLSREGLVQMRVAGRRRLVFPAAFPEVPGETLAHARAVLHGATAVRIARLVAQRPGAGVAEVADALGATPRVVYYHLKRLVDAGLVTSGSPRRYVDLRPTPALVAGLASLPDEA